MVTDWDHSCDVVVAGTGGGGMTATLVAKQAELDVLMVEKSAYYGDPTVKPNPCLAPLEKPPFYAVQMVAGDLGTKGGLVMDERARPA